MRPFPACGVPLWQSCCRSGTQPHTQPHARSFTHPRAPAQLLVVPLAARLHTAVHRNAGRHNAAQRVAPGGGSSARWRRPKVDVRKEAARDARKGLLWPLAGWGAERGTGKMSFCACVWAVMAGAPAMQKRGACHLLCGPTQAHLNQSMVVQLTSDGNMRRRWRSAASVGEKHKTRCR